MLRVSIAQRANLSWFMMRSAARKLAVSINRRPFLDLPFGSAKSDRLVIAPHDLRTADATRASEIYAGRFAFAGKSVICDARSPFEMVPPSDEWAAALLGFGWLRHLRAADSGISRANARALVDEWLGQQSSLDPIAWRPDVVARRVMSWLSQATVVLHEADLRFYRRFLRSLGKQVRYLRRTASDARDGVPRFQAVIALTYAALCIASQLRYVRAATARLVDEIDRQILPDGGHISRNPGALIELMLDLLPLRQAYTARNIAPPPELLNAIDRMMPMLRFFRHDDGNFALFNGMGPTPQDLLTALLAHDDARGAPVANATHSGYQRIDAGDTVLLMDTGRLPPLPVSHEAHAGCLSFELSARQSRIVVNCGLPEVGREVWRHVARATAAHSTATINDTSCATFVDGGPMRGLLDGTALIGGPETVDASRGRGDDTVTVSAAHDGYAKRFNVIHRRNLALANDGTRLDGDDVFSPASGGEFSRRTPLAFALRFHLHPTVKATRLADGHSVMLVTANKDAWTFSAPNQTVELEESVYLAGRDGPRRTVQIVIAGKIGGAQRVGWSFALNPPAAGGARRDPRDEPRLPL